MGHKDYWTEEEIEPELDVMEENFVITSGGIIFSKEAYEDFKNSL